MRLWLSKNSAASLREQLGTQLTLGVISGDLKPGEKLPDVVPTLWDKWVGFPSGLAHGMAIFLGICALWNVWGLARSKSRVA